MKRSVIYISHGGGPLPLLGDPAHADLVDFLKTVPNDLVDPSAILIFSAHWEESVPTITSGISPSLIYDYYGFPEESYNTEYPAKGNPALAIRIHDLLTTNGIHAKMDDRRGFDHGLFVPLKIMYPSANIPCVQVSLVKGLRPDEHIRIGKALASLLSENLLVIGSGFSFHNLHAFFGGSTEKEAAMNESFENWLIDTCSNSRIEENVRQERLIDWEAAPGARYCHPREEHLLPLHICYGIAGSPSKKVNRVKIMGKLSSAYQW